MPLIDSPSCGEERVASGLRQPTPSDSKRASGVAVAKLASEVGLSMDVVASKDTVGIGGCLAEAGKAGPAKFAMTKVAINPEHTSASIAADRINLFVALSRSSEKTARRKSLYARKVALEYMSAKIPIPM